MRRILLSLTLAGLFGAFVVSDAQACHKKKAECPPPAPVCEPAPPPPPPVCEPAPTCEPAPKKHCFKMPKIKFGGFCHKKAAPVCEAAPVAYEAPAPVYAAPQATASPQVHATGQ